MSDEELTVFYAFYNKELFSAFRYKSSQKSKVSKVLKRASVGRFFRTGNFDFFSSGLFTAIGARAFD